MSPHAGGRTGSHPIPNAAPDAGRGVSQYAPTNAPVWQRNYYEHIIRNERELNRIREYIEQNPARWATDEENPLVPRRVAPRRSAGVSRPGRGDNRGR